MRISKYAEWSLLCGCAAVIAVSCGGTVEQGIGFKSSKLDPPLRYTDPKGKVWNRVGEVTDWADEAESEEDWDSPSEDIYELTDQELAEKLRPIALIDGWEYEALFAPLQLAIDMKSGAAEEYDYGDHGTVIGSVGDDEEFPGEELGGGLGGEAYILGSQDDRQIRSDNT